MEGIAKTMFSQNAFIWDSRVDFWCFLEALGAGFPSFSALETGLKIECFSRSSWGPGWHQKIKVPAARW